MQYADFIQEKRHSIGDFGFKPKFYPDIAFDFQKYIIEKSILKGRIGIFADTVIAHAVVLVNPFLGNIYEYLVKNSCK